MEKSASELLKTLRTLRWLAVAGQSITVALATGPLGMALSAPALWSVLGMHRRSLPRKLAKKPGRERTPPDELD